MTGRCEEALDTVEATVSLNKRVGEDEVELGDCSPIRSRSIRDVCGRRDARPRRPAGGRAAPGAGAADRRTALRLRGEVQSLEAIGRELGITRERVRQLEANAFQQLEQELENLVDPNELAQSA